MRIDGKDFRTIWLAGDGQGVDIIDQTKLPHHLEIVTLRTLTDAATAISDMLVRGAPLIGATGAYGMALAMREDASDSHLDQAYEVLVKTRPTAVNLKWRLTGCGRYLPLYRHSAAGRGLCRGRPHRR